MNELFRRLTLNQTYRESLAHSKAREEKAMTKTLIRTLLFMDRNKITIPEMEYHETHLRRV